jgi:ubiquinone/menaquinone biosynthesis C-methylase UbiE
MGTIEPTCPRCDGTLAGADRSWICLDCGAGYRGLRGIPDLRVLEDVYLANDNDWAIAEALDADFDRLDFRGLLDRYFERANDVTPAQQARQVEHILSAPERVRSWLDALGPSASAGPTLDLGCGSGSFLAAVGGDGGDLIGVDIAMRWLVVARKRLDEEGLNHVRLVCGCAERLPFRPGSFARVVAGDVIEHVADQSATLNEAHRVLRPGGALFLASPNRYSLAPEPHVGVWGVGYLPRAWMPAYVRWTSGRDFRAIRTLGFGEWKRLFERSEFRDARIEAPRLPVSEVDRFRGGKRRLGRIYNAVIGTRAGQAVALAFGPLFHVVCRKAGPPATAPSPATRRGSRLPAGPG